LTDRTVYIIIALTLKEGSKNTVRSHQSNLFYGYDRALDIAEADAIGVSLTPAANAE
jgi:hypothetical protein